MTFWTPGYSKLFFPKCLWIVMRGAWNIRFHPLEDSLLNQEITASRNQEPNPEAFRFLFVWFIFEKILEQRSPKNPRAIFVLCRIKSTLLSSCWAKETLVEKAAWNSFIKFNTYFFLKWKGVTWALDLPLNSSNSLAFFWKNPSLQKCFQPWQGELNIIS